MLHPRKESSCISQIILSTSEEALKDNGLICLTILKQRSTQAMAWLLLIALFQIHSGSKPTKQFGEERLASLSCTRQGGNTVCYNVSLLKKK